MDIYFHKYGTPKNPFQKMICYIIYRLGYHSRHTVHGFRSLADTILNESRKWYPDVIELQLAHQEGNKVRRAYNRAEHLDERRKMMLWWANYVDSLMIPADVIDLITERKRRAWWTTQNWVHKTTDRWPKKFNQNTQIRSAGLFPWSKMIDEHFSKAEE